MTEKKDSPWEWLDSIKRVVEETIDDRVGRLISRYVDRQIKPVLVSINAHLLGIEENISLLGERMSEATDLLGQISDATDKVAARIQALVDKLAQQGDASPEVLDALRAEVGRLQALGADPDNPVPDPGPEPEPVDDGS